MKKCLMALLLGLLPWLAMADEPAAPTASSLAPQMTADDYLRCSSQYFLLSQMQGHPTDINYGAAVGLSKAIAVVISSDDYVAKHQPPITADELKKIQDANQTGAMPAYMESFRYQLKQCARAIDQASAVYGRQLQAYTKSHRKAAEPATPAASGGH